jgi:hypothetical protein
MTVREFEHIGEIAILEIAKVVPSKIASALHELLIRVDTSKERQKKATTAIDYNDEKAIQQRLFAVIGEICFTDFSQMESRIDWTWKTMTARQRNAMINALVNACVEEEEE